MGKHAATLIAWIAHALLVRLLVRRTDAQVVRLASRLRSIALRLGRSPAELQPLDDVITIFGMGPEATKTARRFVLEADPDQFRAIVRGALWR